MKNSMDITFSSIAQNERFARVVISAFAAQLDPTMEEIQDIKTAVSEAVTNSIVHGYESDPSRLVKMSAVLTSLGDIEITISDDGIGIDDLEQAREPFFTTKPEMDRSGMGFTVMESFMDELKVESQPGKGTRVIMSKRIAAGAAALKPAVTLDKVT
ncbi:MAG: anti-sigma F factor [Christensenellales bacterium]